MFFKTPQLIVSVQKWWTRSLRIISFSGRSLMEKILRRETCIWEPGSARGFCLLVRQFPCHCFSHKIPFKQTWRRLKRQFRTPRTQADRHAPSLFTRAQGLGEAVAGGGAVARERSAPCWRPHQGNGAKIAETAHGIKTSLAELRRVPNHLVSHKKPFWNCQSYLSNPC